MILALLTLWLMTAILVGWFARVGRTPREVDSWASTYGVELTARNRPMVTYYVRLAVVLRVIGGVSAIGLGQLFDDAMGLRTTEGPGFWVWVILGWLLGATWAEYRLTRPVPATSAASLTPRDVGDYLSPWFHWAPVAAATLAAGFAVVGLVAPLDVPGEPTPSTPGLVTAIVGVAAIALLVTLAVRAVVARKQPATDPSIVAADDAIRSSAVHHLVGGGTAAILLIANQVWLLVTEPHQLPVLGGWVPALLLVAALFSWRFFAYSGWRVRRTTAVAS